jgi:hypothetical protein
MTLNIIADKYKRTTPELLISLVLAQRLGIAIQKQEPD